MYLKCYIYAVVLNSLKDKPKFCSSSILSSIMIAQNAADAKLVASTIFCRGKRGEIPDDHLYSKSDK